MEVKTIDGVEYVKLSDVKTTILKNHDIKKENNVLKAVCSNAAKKIDVLIKDLESKTAADLNMVVINDLKEKAERSKTQLNTQVHES